MYAVMVWMFQTWPSLRFLNCHIPLVRLVLSLLSILLQSHGVICRLALNNLTSLVCRASRSSRRRYRESVSCSPQIYLQRRALKFVPYAHFYGTSFFHSFFFFFFVIAILFLFQFCGHDNWFALLPVSLLTSICAAAFSIWLSEGLRYLRAPLSPTANCQLSHQPLCSLAHFLPHSTLLRRLTANA